MPAARIRTWFLRAAPALAALSLAAPAAARAEPVQQIDVRLTDVRPDGRYAVDRAATMPLLRQAPFQADYQYATGRRSSTTVTVPCPRFAR